MRSVRRPRGPVALLAVASLVSLLGASQQAALDEAELKAAFVYRIASFVSWPVAALGPADQPLRVVVVGDEDLAGEIERAFADRRIEGHGVRVSSVARPDEVGAPHVVFFAEQVDVSGFLARAGAEPVLSMSDAHGFAARGGIVELVRDGTRLRFELNAASARRAGIKLSSQLLRLASHIHDASAES